VTRDQPPALADGRDGWYDEPHGQASRPPPMKFLITNDDGIHAAGIGALAAIARQLGEVWIVAPDCQYSGCGHRMTVHDPIHVDELDATRFAVRGTPADCVRLALHHICGPVDWVLSGVNEGGNLGLDVYLSGTVAAAREASWMGVPAVAVSQYHRAPMNDQFWARSTELLTRLLEQLLSQRPEPHRFWNVNLPDWHDPQLATNGGPRLVHCPLDPSPFPGEYRRLENAFHFVNDYHGRPRRADHDIDVCFRGDVAITLI